MDSGAETEETALIPSRTGTRERRGMLRLCCSVSAGVSGVICLILGILIAILFDPFINSVIDKELIIKNDPTSEMYKLWTEPPIVPYLRIYFFNFTNKDDFMKFKAKPVFKEVGPYSYREKWRKINVTFHDNGTVSYMTKKEYYFESATSNGSEDDIIRTLNVPVNVAAEKFSKMGRLAQLGLSSILVILNETAFVDKTVKQLVWGYKDPLMEAAKKYLPKDQQIPFDKFGFFYLRNGSTDGLFNVFTGANDIGNLTIIDTFNHTRELKYWKTPECNQINGTDGTSFPPNIKMSDTLYMFNENLCRSLPLQYNNTNEHYGIESYRFTPPSDVFANTEVKPENECFCSDDLPCVGGGVFNIGACKFNVSSILSWPHFYQADQKYLDALIGLNPDPLKHSLYIDVNPKLGMPLSAEARIQINFLTQNLTHVKQVANMTPMIFPVLWFEDGVDKLPPKVISLMEKSVYLPKVMKLSMMCVFFVAGVILLVICAARLILHHRNSSNLSITKDKSVLAISDSGHVNPVVSPENPD